MENKKEVKTFNEIMTEAVEKAPKRYYRGNTMTRSKALTLFIEELSKSEEFILLSACINNCFDRDNISAGGEILFTTYAKFSIGDTQYYFQYDDNPFFETFFTIGKKDHETYPLNFDFMKNVTWDNTPENVNILLDNMKDAFSQLSPKASDWYKRIEPAYMRGQSIYYQ
jgi:hypothetical protein